MLNIDNAHELLRAVLFMVLPLVLVAILGAVLMSSFKKISSLDNFLKPRLVMNLWELYRMIMLDLLVFMAALSYLLFIRWHWLAGVMLLTSFFLAIIALRYKLGNFRAAYQKATRYNLKDSINGQVVKVEALTSDLYSLLVKIKQQGNIQKEFEYSYLYPGEMEDAPQIGEYVRFYYFTDPAYPDQPAKVVGKLTLTAGEKARLNF